MSDLVDERDAILAGLEPLLQDAEAEGKWLHCAYQNLWFSPEELRAHHRDGRFVWGAINWSLRDPAVYRLEEVRKFLDARDRYRKALARLGEDPDDALAARKEAV